MTKEEIVKCYELAKSYKEMCNGRECEDCCYDLADCVNGVSLCELMYGYEKGRADAIDDCIKLIGGNITSLVGTYDKTIPFNDRAYARYIKNEFIVELVKQLEQLKEQKNEKNQND